MRSCLIILVFSEVYGGTEFWIGRPNESRLDAFLNKHKESKPNAVQVAKCTLPSEESFPKGFARRQMQRRLPKGSNFAKAEKAVLNWGSSRSGSSFVYKKENDPTMATCAKTYFPGVWVVNPVLETYRIQQRNYAAVAYTTIGNHLLAGEERLMISREPDSSLAIDIISICRGNGPFGRILFPFIGPMQHRFFQAQLDFVQSQAIS